MKHEKLAKTKRAMSIEQALIWAFQTECASIDFAEEASPDSYRRAVSATWLVAQRGVVGCAIDGGGHSNPAHDADMIASAVAALPEEHGGKVMAVQIATLARAGGRPDAMVGAVPRCIPFDRSLNQHGWQASTEDSKQLGIFGWQPVKRRNRKGVIVEDPVKFCPVIYEPTSRQIAAARRNWLEWWGALLHIGYALRSISVLEGIEVTNAMPPMHPWKMDA